jgi:hypothetical protein
MEISKDKMKQIAQRVYWCWECEEKHRAPSKMPLLCLKKPENQGIVDLYIDSWFKTMLSLHNREQARHDAFLLRNERVEDINSNEKVRERASAVEGCIPFGKNKIYNEPDRDPVDRQAASMFWGAPK